MAKKEERVYRSTAFRSNDISRSVRATIPEAVAASLGIGHETKLEWKVDAETRKVSVAVRKS